MDMLTGLLVGLGVYCSFKLGQASQKRLMADHAIHAMLAKTRFPVGVAEKIEGHYYLYEKDSTNFLCQAPTLEELAKNLLDNKKISIAALMCPEDAGAEVFWCVNGKLLKNHIKT